jgi:sortase A
MSSNGSINSSWRRLEQALWTLGALCLVSVLAATAYASWSRRVGLRELDREIATVSRALPQPSRAVVPPPTPQAGEVIGRIEIPRLELDAVVLEGVAESSLMGGVGHIPRTALPGFPGNVGLAAHRDLHFRELRHIIVGDHIRLTTPGGIFDYRVSGTQIVEPNAIWVLDAPPPVALTLVTCYPFRWIGRAPQRFIVQAVLSPAQGDLVRGRV